MHSFVKWTTNTLIRVRGCEVDFNLRWRTSRKARFRTLRLNIFRCDGRKTRFRHLTRILIVTFVPGDNSLIQYQFQVIDPRRNEI